MNEKLGESGILFSNAFHFNLLIKRLEEDVLPIIEKNKCDMIKKFIRFLKDENTFFEYQKDYESYKCYIRLIDDEKREHWFHFSFDDAFTVIHLVANIAHSFPYLDFHPKFKSPTVKTKW